MPTPPNNIPGQHPFAFNQAHGAPRSVIPYGINRDSGQNDPFPFVTGPDGLLVTISGGGGPPATTSPPWNQAIASTFGVEATTTSQIVLTSNSDRVSFIISNPGPEIVAVSFGSVALPSGGVGPNVGHKLDPNGSLSYTGYSGDVSVIASANQYINVTEFTI